MVMLYLTCADDAEAQKISQAILEAKLAACVRMIPITSSFWWDGAIQHASEVQLLIETRQEKFDAINELLEKLHSYKDYVLTQSPVTKTTPGVLQWIDEITQ